MWNCIISPTRVIGEQPKYWENMATTNDEKDAQKRSENIKICNVLKFEMSILSEIVL